MFIRRETLGSREAAYGLTDCNLPRKVCFCTWTASRSKTVGKVCSAGRRPSAGERLTHRVTLRKGRKAAAPVFCVLGIRGGLVYLQENDS